MPHRHRLILLVVLVLWAAPRPAAGALRVSTLAAVRADSPTVLVATFVDRVGPQAQPTGYLLQVEKALVGSVSPGPLQVRAVAGEIAYLAKGARFVAFLDGSGALKYAATLRAGPTLEEGVLRVEGFYDFDSHVVTPGILTLAQLVRYLRTGALEYVFRGKIHFVVPGTSAAAPSSIDLTVGRDEIQGTSTVTGMPALRGLPAAPGVLVGEGYFSDLTLGWNSGWPRPLIVSGESTGVDPATGAILMRFWVATPVALTEPELRRYVDDPSVVSVEHLVTLSVAGGGTRSIVISSAYAKIRAPGAAPILEVDETSLAPRRYFKGPGVDIDLDPQAPGLTFLGHGGVEAELVQELSAGPIGCSVRFSGRPPARCSLALGSTLLATR
jgi:hypothetical protein